MDGIRAMVSRFEAMWWQSGQPMSHGRAPFASRRTWARPCVGQTSSVRMAKPQVVAGRPMLNRQSG